MANMVDENASATIARLYATSLATFLLIAWQLANPRRRHFQRLAPAPVPPPWSLAAGPFPRGPAAFLQGLIGAGSSILVLIWVIEIG